MNSEEFLKRSDEILETIWCWESLEDEALKLYCLIHRCKTHVSKDGEDFISRKYLIEKTGRLINKTPIILDEDGCRMFCALKIQREIDRGSISDSKE